MIMLLVSLQCFSRRLLQCVSYLVNVTPLQEVLSKRGKMITSYCLVSGQQDKTATMVGSKSPTVGKCE